MPDWFTPHPKLWKQLERRRTALEQGGHRLGPGGGARVRVAPRRRHPHPDHRPGHRARHVLASPRRPARREHRRDVHADAAPRRGGRVVRDPQLAALGVRLRRLRVRLLRCRAGGARALGSAVRRLRQRRADHHRPVHVGGPLEVARDVAPDAAAAARLRGQRPRALERAARAVPPARRAGEHAHRELHDVGAVLPSRAAPGARRDRAAAHRDDAEGPAAAEAGGSTLDDLARGRVPAGDRRRARRPRAGHAARALLREGLLRHRRPRGPRGRDATSPSRGSSSSIRSRSRRPGGALRGYPNLREVVWAQEEPQNMGAWRAIRPPARGGEAGRRAAALRRPPVAREPERGLPDRAPARAGPDRARGARAVGALRPDSGVAATGSPRAATSAGVSRRRWPRRSERGSRGARAARLSRACR